MGQISVNLSDDMITKVDRVIRKVNGDSIGDQVVMFLEPWIKLAQKGENPDISQEVTTRSNNTQEKYVVVHGDRYRIAYKKNDGMKPKTLCVESSDLSKLNELSRIMQKCGWDRTEWETQKQRLFPKIMKGNIYNRTGKSNRYYVQVGVNGKSYQYGYHLTYPQAEKIRDYIGSLNNEDKINLSYQRYGIEDRGEYTRKVMEQVERRNCG